LVISNGGRVNSRSGDVGFYVGADQEHVLVSGTNSAWNVTGDLCFGSAGGKSSSLAITNGGLVVSSQAFLGYVAGDHMAIVRDPGSFWSAGTNFYIGRYAPGNQLLISNGGQVSNVIAYIGGNSVSSSNNSVLVTDPGSVWSNDLLYVGSGVGNRLVISNQASVFSSGAILSDVGGRGRSSVLVTGSGSIWSNTYYLYVGLGGQNNSLNIADGATLYSSYEAYVGDSTSSSNNVVIVSDPGSTWYNSGPLTLGYNGSGNSLILSNGGRAISLMTRVGQNRSTNNTVLVTGVGSVWSNTGPVHIDSYGNSFVISNGGGFISPFVILGNGSRNNLRVMDDASWQSDTLEFFGVSNSLAVAGGSVNATNVIVYNCDNIIQLDSGSLMITNLSGTATLELQGKLVINGGTLLVDRFVMTNPCAQFVRTGGTLIYGTAVLDPMRDDDGDGMPNGWEQSHGLDPLNAADGNVDSDGDGFTNLQEYMAGTDPQDAASAFRITGIAPEGDDLRVTWMMGSGKTNALQAAAGDGGYYTNNFADIFTVTNTIGSVTNYLDVGAATNVPGRFYRVRLVP
jgi:T5SS/PEP-CTERM-associated repeat protein